MSSTQPTTIISEEAIKSVLPPTLYRLTEALPKTELDVIIREARACEDALEKEIELLERDIGIDCNKKRKLNDDGNDNDTASDNKSSPEQLVEPSIAIPLLPTPYQPGGGAINYLEDVQQILGTDFSPPDRYFTVSALLGRLRIPLKLPATTSAAAAAAASAAAASSGTTVPKSKKEEMEAEKKAKQLRLSFEKQQALLTLDQNDIYHQEHTETTTLLALWKRISSHRTSAVFRKPVNPLEAPGYQERILFPIDLSLIRKMIVCRMIKSYAGFHRCVGLICHNCVKFNGRESDYSALTRDFEDNVDEKVLEAVRNAAAAAAAAKAAAESKAVAATATDGAAGAAAAAPPVAGAAAAAGTSGAA
mmetsp:Transcript_16374/g.24764  ORF Transcript_16374/g.24764 Transcript_16374/m.24764 type:complete len:363 (-) Transcript_16374:95-1183(-)